VTRDKGQHIGASDLDSSPGGLYEACTQLAIAMAGSARETLAGTLMIAGRNLGSTGQVVHRRNTTHVCADLGQQHFRRALIDNGDCIQQMRSHHTSQSALQFATLGAQAPSSQLHQDCGRRIAYQYHFRYGTCRAPCNVGCHRTQLDITPLAHLLQAIDYSSEVLHQVQALPSQVAQVTLHLERDATPAQ